MIALLCLGIFFIGFFGMILEFLIMDQLTPNHVIIAYELGKIPANIITVEGINKLFISLISILQIFCLLFYLEIFECNFCSLNKNTKKNIITRVYNEPKIDIEDNDKDNEIIIGGYDISESIKNQEFEMKEMKDEEK